MSESQLPLEACADFDVRRFSLSVWPQTAARAWRAELSGAEVAAPIRFERPVDLVLFLTELSGSAEWQPRGLR
jgi:hypothetical protein